MDTLAPGIGKYRPMEIRQFPVDEPLVVEAQVSLERVFEYRCVSAPIPIFGVDLSQTQPALSPALESPQSFPRVPMKGV
jgi:hypothetical protein